MPDTTPSTQGSRLDGPPPAPSGVVRRAPPDAAPAGMMMSGGGLSQNTFPQAVIERAMLAEQALQSLSEVAPALTPLAATLVDQLRSGVASALQGGGMGAPQQPAPMGAPGIMGAPPSGAPPAAGAA